MSETNNEIREDAVQTCKRLWTTQWEKRCSPWTGHILKCKKCGSEIGSLSGQLPFCPACGRAATTSAWDILLQRLNETESFKQILKENSAML